MGGWRRWWMGLCMVLVVVLGWEAVSGFDLCVGDLSSKIVTNAFPCKAVVADEDLKSKELKTPGTLSRTGAMIKRLDTMHFSALNMQGIGMSRVDLLAKGLAPPHSHPRAAEVIVVTRGTVKAFLVTSSNPNINSNPNHTSIMDGVQPHLRLFKNTLKPGECMVFPRSLVHFTYNPSPNETAQYISAYNNDNFGVAPAYESLLATHPLIPDKILATTFNLKKTNVRKMREAIGVLGF